MADRSYPLDERLGLPHRLGRNVRHDPRSLRFLVRADGTRKTKQWTRHLPVLDQGRLGSCTGNAGTGVLGSDGLWQTLSAVVQAQLAESYAVQLYSDATKLDSDPDNYPPTDTGSDGLSIAQVLKSRGLVSGYQHITSIDAAYTAIQAGPFITGTNWYSGMFTPDSRGVVTIHGQVEGGHEYEVLGYDAGQDLWHLVNSWGTGWGDQGHFYYSSATYARLLAEQGDATTFVPITQPAPTPAPAPAAGLWPAADVDPWLAQRHTGVARKAQTALVALRTKLTAAGGAL